MQSQLYPNYYPPLCPPQAVQPNDQVVYRLVNHDPPIESDFLSVRQQSPTRKDIRDECRACGLSMFTSYDDAIGQNDALSKTTFFKRKQLPKMLVAHGQTKSECGVTMKTPMNERPSHVTYWLFKDSKVHNDFAVVREKEK